MNEKNSKNKIIVIIVIAVLIFVPIFSIQYNKYQQKIKQDELNALLEQQRIEEEKETKRIEDMKISQTLYISIDEPLNLQGIILSGNSISPTNKDGINYFVGVLPGESIVYNKEQDKKYKISVSNLYEVAHIDNYKENIFLNAYSAEEAKYLDEVLKNRIEAVGYKTRAAVAEAARFLAMNFPYKIPYFCENGRLTTNGCDGEGRFYHEGLYLSEDKFAILNPNGIKQGPQPWGGKMQDVCATHLRPNGLDCSGFVTWCLVQAGFDPGDYGAGSNFPGESFNLIDLAAGDAGAIWLNNIDPDEIQAGDIIAWTGTVAIVVGVDEENIYTAHEYWDNGLEVVTDSKESLKTYPQGEDCGDWQYVSLMDNYYKENGNGNGNYTPMWNNKIN